MASAPSAAIFDVTMLVTGAMILLAAWLVYRALGRAGIGIPIALLGLGVLGVGIFPLTALGPHTVFALLALYAGGAAAVLSSRLAPAPFRHLWLGLGVIALVAITLGLFFLEWGPVAALGEGGIERWNVYPLVLWLVAFGTYLMTTPARKPGRT